MAGMLAEPIAFAQTNPFWGAVVVALLVGAAHFATHTLAGDREAFDEAGVAAAGFAVMAVAGVLAFVLLAAGGGA